MNSSTNTSYKNRFLLYLAVITVSLSTQSYAADQPSLIIGFGSCADQNRQQPIWEKIATHNPELFILMGDNVYIDSSEPKKMERAYQALSNNPNFSKFRKKVPLIATWDDHDYGITDGGKDFIGKQHAKKAFIDFFNYSELKETEQNKGGIFHSRWIDFNNKKIQIILLDTRWYRDELVRSYLTGSQRETLNLGPYQPSLDNATTLLGQQQWIWLENELKKPADLRLIISSIQVLTEYSGWETWANFPHQRQKLLDMLHQYNNDNLLILSGDIHKAEISKLNYIGQKLTEITSSGLAVNTYPAAVNKHRQGKAFEKKNYGILHIQDNGKLSVVASIYSENGDKKLTTKLGE